MKFVFRYAQDSRRDKGRKPGSAPEIDKPDTKAVSGTNAPLRPLRCFGCGAWERLPDSAWWAGRCSLSGERRGFRDSCTLPGQTESETSTQIRPRRFEDVIA